MKGDSQVFGEEGNLSIFSFMVIVSCPHLKFSAYSKFVKTVKIFFQKLLVFMFRFVTKFELIFMYGMRQESGFIIFCMSNIVPAHLEQTNDITCLYSLNCLNFPKRIDCILCGSASGLSCSTEVVAYPWPILYCLDYHSFIISPQIKKSKFHIFFFLFQDFWLLWSFEFLYKF